MRSKTVAQHQKGFTLIELLVVIGIIAVLSVVAILTLNPAELLRQARDSNRISDAATLKSVISLYMADVSSTVLATSYGSCYESIGTATTSCVTAGIGSVTGVSGTSSRKVDNTGWVPVNLTTISAGSPIGSLPIDPLNNGTYFYTYAATSSPNFGFKVAVAALESVKYKAGGSGDVVTNSGCTPTGFYCTGTNLGL